MKPDTNLLRQWIYACLLLFAMVSGTTVMAQQSPVVTGIVTNEKNEALQGVTVIAVANKETQTGTTDEKENFIFKKLTAEAVYDFSVSFIGYETGTLKYLVKNNILEFRLKSSTASLNEVVVTALGIKREEKSPGYAAQTVTENAVKDAKTNNLENTGM